MGVIELPKQVRLHLELKTLPMVCPVTLILYMKAFNLNRYGQGE